MKQNFEKLECNNVRFTLGSDDGSVLLLLGLLDDELGAL